MEFRNMANVPSMAGALCESKGQDCSPSAPMGLIELIAWGRVLAHLHYPGVKNGT